MFQVLKEMKLLTNLPMKDDITKNIKILEVECSDRGDWRSAVSSMMLNQVNKYAVKKKTSLNLFFLSLANNDIKVNKTQRIFTKIHSEPGTLSEF